MPLTQNSTDFLMCSASFFHSCQCNGVHTSASADDKSFEQCTWVKIKFAPHSTSCTSSVSLQDSSTSKPFELVLTLVGCTF